MEVVKRARRVRARMGRWEAHFWGFVDREGGGGLGWGWEWSVTCLVNEKVLGGGLLGVVI